MNTPQREPDPDDPLPYVYYQLVRDYPEISRQLRLTSWSRVGEPGWIIQVSLGRWHEKILTGRRPLELGVGAVEQWFERLYDSITNAVDYLVEQEENAG